MIEGRNVDLSVPFYHFFLHFFSFGTFSSYFLVALYGELAANLTTKYLSIS